MKKATCASISVASAALGICLVSLPAFAGTVSQDEDAKIRIEVGKALFKSGQEANQALINLGAARGLAGAPVAKIKMVDPAKAPPSLRQKITLTWNGRADELVKKIAAAVGYRFKYSGLSHASPTVVTMVFDHVPAVDALQKIGLRINHTSKIIVAPARHLITYDRSWRVKGVSGALVMSGAGY